MSSASRQGVKLTLLHVGMEETLIKSLGESFQSGKWNLEQAHDVSDCLGRLEQGSYDVLLTSSDPQGLSVEQLLEEALRRRPHLAVMVLSYRPDYAEAVRVARYGAADYLPVDASQGSEAHWIEQRARRACEEKLQQRSNRAPQQGPRCELVGRSKAIEEVLQLVHLIAPRQSTILISGRTGTGKELVARAIHRASSRSSRPMVVVNCGAIPENLIEAEFFGHVKGAFTGAVGHRVGRFEQAQGGTIFLDEIGEMPLEMQSKLLRVLQEREFQRVGSSETVSVDLRVIAATNCDLKEMVQHGNFREDLYYRLNVVPIHLPSLAERAEDVPLLVDHLLARICRRENLRLKRAGPETMRRLVDYSWPGNVRQLENAIEKAVALSGDRTILYPSDFPLPSAPLAASSSMVPAVQLPAAGLDFGSVVTQFERSLLDQALQRSGGNKKRAAELLRIKRTTFAAKWRVLQGGDRPS